MNVVENVEGVDEKVFLRDVDYRDDFSFGIEDGGLTKFEEVFLNGDIGNGNKDEKVVDIIKVKVELDVEEEGEKIFVLNVKIKKENI